MARMAIAGRMSAIATTVRGPSVYATAAVRPNIREIGVFNTGTLAVAVAVVRATAIGTRGAAITAVCLDDDSHTAVVTGANTHTADATVLSPFRQGLLGAGSGVIFTFGAEGITLNNATTAGVVITCPTGTGQICDFYIEWTE